MANIQFESSVLQQARQGNKNAIRKMFSSFIGDGEQIIDVEYFGSYGVFFTTKSYVCLTDKKIYTMQYGPFGKIILSDAFLEEVNSGVIYQPSVFQLYFVGILLCVSLFGIILLNAWIRLFYQINKSGLVWSIREGFSVYAFANRSSLSKVNAIWRKVSVLREQRKLMLK